MNQVHETSELAPLLALLQQQQAEVQFLREKLAQLEAEMGRLKSTPPEPEKSNVPAKKAFPTSRRRLLKKLVAGVGMAALAGTASIAQTGPVEAATGGNMKIGENNVPSNVADLTWLSTHSGGTQLSPLLLRVNNYTNLFLDMPEDYKIGLAATVSSDVVYNVPIVYPKTVAIYGEIGAVDYNSYAIWGKAERGIGVYGESHYSTGVYGYSDLGNGVVGKSIDENNSGVYGEGSSLGYGGHFKGGKAPLRLEPGYQSGPPTSTVFTHYAGEFYVDKDGALFYCVDSGKPGTWRLLAS